MSIYSDYKVGAMSYEEFRQAAAWEARKEKYYEDKMYEDDYDEDEEEEDDDE